jgi:hypothetical protein
MRNTTSISTNIPKSAARTIANAGKEPCLVSGSGMDEEDGREGLIHPGSPSLAHRKPLSTVIRLERLFRKLPRQVISGTGVQAMIKEDAS